MLFTLINRKFVQNTFETISRNISTSRVNRINSLSNNLLTEKGHITNANHKYIGVYQSVTLRHSVFQITGDARRKPGRSKPRATTRAEDRRNMSVIAVRKITYLQNLIFGIIGQNVLTQTVKNRLHQHILYQRLLIYCYLVIVI